jgi:hypothetical protein
LRHAEHRRGILQSQVDLLERTFAVGVLDCPECGGTLRLIATIHHRAVIENILRHLGLPIDVSEPARHQLILPLFWLAPVVYLPVQGGRRWTRQGREST